MPVNQLQKSCPQQQPGARPLLSRKVLGQDGSFVSAQAVATRPKISADLEQHQTILPVERQSQKVVQDLINAAIGCVTYLRGLIPEKSFSDMSYGGAANELQPQTQSGAASQESDKARKKKESGTRVKLIRRGFSSEADTLLDLIEKGIFGALSKGYLKAFQLAVFLDIDHPEIIQEAYTFSINYRRKESGKSVDIKDIIMSTTIQNGTICDQSAELLDVAQINRSVRALIRRLIVITQNLDLLPENRYLTIRLYHTSDAPEGWTPPMFTQSTGKPLWFDNDVSNALSDEVFGIMETGLHTVQARVTSGKRPFSETRADASDSEDGTPHLPKRQRHGGPVGAHNFIEFAPSHDHPPRPGWGTRLPSQNGFSRGVHGITNDPMLIPSETHRGIDGSSFETLTVGTARTDRVTTQGPESVCFPTRNKRLREENALPGLELCRSISIVPQLRLGELKLEELSKTVQGSDQDEGCGRQAGNNQIKCECGVEAEGMDSV